MLNHGELFLICVARTKYWPKNLLVIQAFFMRNLWIFNFSMAFQMAKTENRPFLAFIDCICQIQMGILFHTLLWIRPYPSIWLGYYQQCLRLFAYRIHRDQNRCLNIYQINNRTNRKQDLIIIYQPFLSLVSCKCTAWPHISEYLLWLQERLEWKKWTTSRLPWLASLLSSEI